MSQTSYSELSFSLCDPASTPSQSRQEEPRKYEWDALSFGQPHGVSSYTRILSSFTMQNMSPSSLRIRRMERKWMLAPIPVPVTSSFAQYCAGAPRYKGLSEQSQIGASRQHSARYCSIAILLKSVTLLSESCSDTPALYSGDRKPSGSTLRKSGTSPFDQEPRCLSSSWTTPLQKL
jgi:hypothetical protein